MIEATGRLVFARVEGKHSAIPFKLVVQERIPRFLSRVEARSGSYRQGGPQRDGTSGKSRLTCARYTCGQGSIASRSQRGQNRFLIIREISLRTKNIRVRQQGNRILCVLSQACKTHKQKGFVFLDGEAQCSPVLLAIQGILDGLALRIGLSRIKRRARLQRLIEGKRVACIKNIVTEKAVETAVHPVGA